MKIFNTQNYRFTFIDSDTGQPVTDCELRAELLVENESPLNYPFRVNWKINGKAKKAV